MVTHLGDSIEEAVGAQLGQGQGAVPQARHELQGVAGLQGLRHKALQAGRNGGAEHDGAAQDVHLAQDLVRLAQGLHEPNLV